MDFDYSPRTQDLQAQLLRFMDEHIYPNEQRFEDEVEANAEAGKRWTPLQVIEELKPKARAQGLWNLFLPPTAGARARRTAARGLSNLDYAPLCEIMGRVPWSPRGLQLLGARHRQHGDARALRHRRRRRSTGCEPLLDGEIRSRLPDDRAGGGLVGRHQHPVQHPRATATTTSSTAASGGPRGAGDPRCKIFIVMGKTDPDAPRHAQQSMILVPRDTPGVTVVRPLHGVRLRRRAARPHGGAARERARAGRRTSCSARAAASRSRRAASGPGRIHHCMRSIGAGRARARDDVRPRCSRASPSASRSPSSRCGTSASPSRAA